MITDIQLLFSILKKQNKTSILELVFSISTFQLIH